MSSHELPTGAETETDRQAVAALVALLVVGVLAVGFAPGVASAEDIVERDGSDLVVNISEVDNPDTVTVEVTDPSETGIVYRENATGYEEVLIDVTDPAEGIVNGTDLQNATVTVTVERHGENATPQITNGTEVPLHAVAIADDRPAWIDTVGEAGTVTDRLYVPLDAAGTVGVAENDAVSVDVDGSGVANVTATLRAGGDQLVIDHDDLIDAAGNSRETLSLEVLSSAGPVIDNPSIEPELRSTRDGLALWHPLFAPDETYTVNAQTIGEDARYTATDADTEQGYLELVEMPASETAIRVSSTDGTTFANYTDDPLAYAGQPEIDATVVDDGTLRVDRSLAGLDVNGALVRTNGGPTYASVNDRVDDDGRLALDSVDLSSANTLLLSTAAGEVSVTLESGSGGGGVGGGWIGELRGFLPMLSVLLVPLSIGALPGVVVGHRSQRDPKIAETVILGVLGFALAGLAAVGMLVVFADELFATASINLVGYVGVLLGTVATGTGHQVLAENTVVAASDPFAAKVTITDGSDLFRDNVTVHYRKPGGQDRYDPVRVRDGRKTIQMPGSGTWEVYARHGSARSSVKTVDASDPSATLAVPVEASLTVVDATDGQPVADATISDDDGISGTTDRNGTVTLDPPEDTTEVDIEVSHDRYVNATECVRFRQNTSHTVEIDRQTGRLHGSARVDGVAAGAVPLRIVPDDDFVSDRFEVEKLTTDSDGTLDRREIPIGRYRVEAALVDRDGAYEGTETTVTVSESGTARADVDARFTWRLDADHQNRIDRIRSDIRSLSDSVGRDGAIPRYYASVVESMLATAESVPDVGHEFVGREIDPGEAVDGILAAAEQTTDAISEVMTTKRNIDLFAACADMPDADVRWSGSFELARLLDRFEADSSAQRREVKQRYEAVDGLIEDRRGDLAEIAPAREIQQRAWELTREADRGLEAVAIGYTSLLLLDAVEELFEHDALRGRLTRTVF